MEKELVSVVITTYKRRVSQIKAAIDSVLNQSHENLELIIVDDSPNEQEPIKLSHESCLYTDPLYGVCRSNTHLVLPSPS